MNNQARTNGPFDLWYTLLQHSQPCWSPAAAASPGPAPVWHQAMTRWSEFWSQALTLSPEIIPASQKLWLEQLDVMEQGLAEVAGTDAFARMQSQLLELQLAWQAKATQLLQPQIEAALRSLHLPSREQIERLFERLIGLEERLDDLEVANRPPP